MVPSHFHEVKVRSLVLSSFFLSSSNFQLVSLRCLHRTKFSIPFVWMLTVSLVVDYVNYLIKVEKGIYSRNNNEGSRKG